jgi:hypothetical protein
MEVVDSILYRERNISVLVLKYRISVFLNVIFSINKLRNGCKHFSQVNLNLRL